MSTIHKFKAYFGMVPPGDYEDDYLDDPAPARPRRSYERDYRDEADYRDVEYRDDEAGGGARPVYRDVDERDFREADFREADFREGEYERVPEYAYAGARRPQFESIDRYAAAPARVAGRLEPLSSVRTTASARPGPSAGPSTRGALALDSRAEVDRVFEEGSPLGKITTLRPSSYAEARTIGERFRDGSPVIMDLVEMTNADAKRLVDFAAGLAFALHGSFDKVATKVFLLAPSDIDVSPEDRRKIAETGFYNHQ
ncbi:cell division inhibitor SepF [Williamsia limnetica]|jgi:cell division inhibitor SepF|uniref:Cell division protein SepF n=1 Tax=Williamsia limnetica TaxID=882452 RepID=A0A318RJG4_WILLI|nr:cell division protein SepF [Williamsia limnetica]PYE15805.1 cell division inhibitor SepF [Williamsia limnetica]